MTAPRREFSDKVKAKIVHRAMNADGHVVCEGCGYVLGKKPYEIDHIVAEALVVDKTKELTAEDGRLLGKKCCHDPKSAKDRGVIAKSKRSERKIRFGIKKATGRPMDGTRRSPFKAKIGGGGERREAR